MKKKILFLLPVVALFGVLAFTYKPMEMNVARAEDGATSEVVTSEEVASEEVISSEEIVEEEDTKSLIQQFKDTFLVPLLSGVSAFSLLTTVISITIAIINKKSNGKLKEKAVEVISTATSVITQANQMKEYAEKQYEEAKKLSLEVGEKADKLLADGKVLEANVERLYGIKDSVVALLEVEAKKLANDGNAVASGLAEDVNKLVADTKKLIK